MKKSTSNFRGKIVHDSQKQQKAAVTYGHLLLPKNVNIFNPEPESKVKLDFLPYEVTDERHPDRDAELNIAIPGTLWYKRPYKLHRNIGVNNDSYVCPTSIGKKCPICEYRQKRIKEGADREETDTMKTSQRNLYVVVPLDSKKYEKVPSIFDISQYLFQNMLNKELEDNEEYGIFPDIEEGLTLKIRFEASTIGSSKPFAEVGRIDFYERDEKYTTDIMEKIPNLDKVLKILTYDELHSIYFELEEETDGGNLKPAKDDEEDEKSTRVRKTIKPAKDDEEYNKDEEQVTEKAPMTRKAKPNTPPERTASTETKATDKADRCPYGHKFGVDTESYDDCDTCEIWSDCIDTMDAKKK